MRAGIYPPRLPAKDILVTTGTVPEPYEEIGIILTRKYPGSLEEEMIEKFREEARKEPFFSIGPFFFSIPFYGIESKGVAVRFKKEKP